MIDSDYCNRRVVKMQIKEVLGVFVQKVHKVTVERGIQLVVCRCATRKDRRRCAL